MIEELVTDGPDETLDVAVHLRRADRGLDGPNAETPDSTGELLSICTVAISDQESRCRVPWKGVDRLLAEPESGRVRGHVRENKAPAFEGQNNEDVDDLKPSRRQGKQVDRDDSLRLVP